MSEHYRLDLMTENHAKQAKMISQYIKNFGSLFDDVMLYDISILKHC